MATKTTKLASALAVLLCMAASYGVSGQAPASSPAIYSGPAMAPTSNDCFTALFNMSDCLTYVEDGSNLTKPDKGCCPELAGLLDSNPICLCNLLGNPNFSGIKIDLKKALKLPSICRLSTPPVAACAAVGVPVSLSPVEGPVSPGSEPTEGSAASPSGAAFTPPSGDNGNGASSINSPALHFILGLSIALLHLLS